MIPIQKLSVDIATLSYMTFCRFNVNLYKFGKDGTAYPFHQQYQYFSDKMNQTVQSIRLSYDYSISIEKNIPESKEFIMLGMNDMYQFIQGLRILADALIHENEVFKITNNTLIVVDNGKHTCQITGLPLDKWIRMEPVVVSGYEGIQFPGVRVYLSSDTNFIDITSRAFMGWLYKMEHLDPVLTAQSMINYLGKPENVTISNSSNIMTGKGGLGTSKSIFQEG